MKRILTVLMFVAVFGMLCGSVVAADLEPYDFKGKFTLDVPKDFDLARQAIGNPNKFSDSNSDLYIEYYTIDDVQAMNCNDFDEYINECLRLDEIETDGDLTVFKDGNDYVVTVHSDEELFIIVDDDLEEAKKIASSANFDDTSSDESAEPSTPVKTTVELGSHDFGDFKMDVPKDSSFKEITDNNAEFNGAKTYFDSVNDVNITFAENEEVNNQLINDMVSSFEEHGVEVKTNGNLNIVSMDSYNEVIFNDGNKIIMIVTTKLDPDTITAMAQSAEFTK